MRERIRTRNTKNVSKLSENVPLGQTPQYRLNHRLQCGRSLPHRRWKSTKNPLLRHENRRIRRTLQTHQPNRTVHRTHRQAHLSTSTLRTQTPARTQNHTLRYQIRKHTHGLQIQYKTSRFRIRTLPSRLKQSAHHLQRLRWSRLHQVQCPRNHQ